MPKVLVTGSGGFIGSHLVELLVEQPGTDVRALVRYNGRNEWGHLTHLRPGVPGLEVVMGDVTDARLVDETVEGCDVVYHLAALIGIPYSYRAPGSYVATNTVGTLNVLEACRRQGVGRLVVTSTSEVYGTARTVPIDERHPLQAQSPYAASKIGADKLAESFHLSFDLPVVTLRPFNTYGPRQSARAVIPTILQQALARRSPIRLGNTTPRRDLTYVADTARAFLLAGTVAGVEGQTINVGQGSSVTIAELAARCLAVTGHEAPFAVDRERTRPPTSEVEVLECDPSRADHLLGWRPEVPLDEGLRRTAAYLHEHRDALAAGGYVT